MRGETMQNMKRVVNGVTYNVSTSELLAKTEWVENAETDAETEHTTELYRTKGGAFFELHLWDRYDPQAEEVRTRSELTPMTESEAQKWLMTGDVEIIENPFDDPPEATAENTAEKTTTLYARITPTLKNAIEKAATKERLSMTQWIERTLGQAVRQGQK
jgi:hypothetical protein